MDLKNYPNALSITIIPDINQQSRTHKKKRINKKWAKRYGFSRYNPIADGDTLFLNNTLFMNPRTYVTFVAEIDRR